VAEGQSTQLREQEITILVESRGIRHEKFTKFSSAGRSSSLQTQ